MGLCISNEDKNRNLQSQAPQPLKIQKKQINNQNEPMSPLSAPIYQSNSLNKIKILKRNLSKNPTSHTTIQADIRNYYELKKVIGHGHFGTVRQGVLIGTTSKLFAVKTIHKSKIKKELHLLKRELDILSQVDHPNIIKFYETYEDAKYFHIVMELCEGGELFDHIINKGKYSEKVAAQLMWKIFSAVNHIHENKVCHRDIKPENFLYETKESNSEIKLIDFGLSTKYGETQMGTMVGTPYYVAPEVLQGNYGPECDI